MSSEVICSITLGSIIKCVKPFLFFFGGGIVVCIIIYLFTYLFGGGGSKRNVIGEFPNKSHLEGLFLRAERREPMSDDLLVWLNSDGTVMDVPCPLKVARKRLWCTSTPAIGV